MSTTVSRPLMVAVLAALVALLLAAPAFALPGQPNFGSALFADGDTYGTKGVTETIKNPNPNSLDKLFVFTNGAEGQLPVAEAAPGKGFNGGRWWVVQATWNDQALIDMGSIPVVMSYAEVMAHVDAGHIDLVYTSTYFNCPLLPDKS